MQIILKFVLGYLLDYLKEGVMGWLKVKNKKDKEASEVDAARDRVRAALDAPKKGVLMTDEQRKEYYAANRALATMR